MSRLDKVLSFISEAFGMMLKELLIILIPVEVAEQICIYATHRPDQMIPLMVLLIMILSCAGWKLIKSLKTKKVIKHEQNNSKVVG